MSTCVVRWRPSGGRGEWEVVPSNALDGRHIVLKFDKLKVDIPTEIKGTISQGKPRLRKDEPNNRSKLHLVPLVMAVARMPDPAREDKTGTVTWPLENKNFIVSHMEFEIVSDTGVTAVLRPMTAQILHSDNTIDLAKRFESVANDIAQATTLAPKLPALAEAIEKHRDAILAGINSSQIRISADKVIELQTDEFGKTNLAGASVAASLPETSLEEDIKGKEGRILTRLHSYRERDRKLVKKAKKLFKAKNGNLYCECCGFNAGTFYGARGEGRIQAHHRTPVEELLPDSVTRPEDLAMVCPNCHDIIHAKRPWLSVEKLRDHLSKTGKTFF